MRMLIDLDPFQRPGQLSPAGTLWSHLLPELIAAAQHFDVTVHLLANTAYAQTIAPLQRRFADQHTAGRLHLVDAPFGTEAPACHAALKAFSIAGLAPDLVLCPTLTTADRTATHLLEKTGLLPCPLRPVEAGTTLEFFKFRDVMQGRHRRPDGPSHTTYQSFGKLAPAQQQARADAYAHLGLFKPYILFTSGTPDHDPQAAQSMLHAYAALDETRRHRLDLVLTGAFDPAAQQALRATANQLGLAPDSLRLLTDLTQENTRKLIAGATLLVDPGTAPALNGMALDAVAAHVPVAAAGTALNTRILGQAQDGFDPADQTSMTALIDRLAGRPEALNALREAQISQGQSADWPHTGTAMMQNLARAVTEPQNPAPLDWPALQTWLDGLEAKTLNALRNAMAQSALDAVGETHLARAVVATRAEVENAHRGYGFGTPAPAQTWRIEGPFDSSYSLAAVNRESARGLVAQGWPVALYSSEGPGPYAPDLAYIDTHHPDLKPMMDRADALPAVASDITSRDMFPPRCDDMNSRFNLLHSYAWEETGFPAAYTRDINRHLQAVTVLSPHVARVMRNAGVAVPITVAGTGVEHMDIPPEPLPFALPDVACRMLHVSSCFPRKGADVLLAAFAQAFSGDADAARDTCLIIKTHDNPHNTIQADVAALRATHPVLPQIILETADLNPGQIRSLYDACTLLVAPSRAEGFCLPIAEAVLAGKPVLATGWSGQMTFKPNPLITFIDYDFADAGSHLDTVDSVWAEPRTDDLAAHMAAARKAPPTDPDVARAAGQSLRARHNWTNVARRNTEAVHAMVHARPKIPARTGWVSTFNTRCGIATYSAHLLAGLPDSPTILANRTTDVQGPDPDGVIRCWTADKHDPLNGLHAAIKKHDLRTIVIQFNYGFFDFATFGRLIRHLKAEGRKIVVMMHATDDTPYAFETQLKSIHVELSLCDRLLVHSVHDLNRLKALGLVDNVALFPHGVLEVPQHPAPALHTDHPFVIGTYGFMLPPKGFPELVEAVGLMRDAGRNVALEMINAEFPVPQSTKLTTQIKAQIAARGLTDHVNLCTDFLEDGESYARLSKAHMLAFPYRPTTESASGAVRQALAISRPIAVTPLPIFDDVSGLVLPLPGFTPPEIATGLGTIMDEMQAGSDEGDVAQALARGAGWRQAVGYSALSKRLWAILQQL